jgi:site-specific DNA-cytosine methylase
VPDASNRATAKPAFTTVGLFAGIGGLELGFQRAGASAQLLCEVWPPAQAVLRARFPGVPIHGDITSLEELPDADVVAAGFPCTDLSQAGRTAGIRGQASGLVSHLFKLLRDARPRWVVIENVRNMLVLDRGTAMDYLVSNLEELGFRWAYRLVDSRFTGVPQRRQRVLMVASREDDPRSVLFADDEGEPDDSWFRDDAFGYYWTEGLTGLGWAKDAVPTLKGGSAIGIPSAPGIWIRAEPPGRAMVTPGITDAEPGGLDRTSIGSRAGRPAVEANRERGDGGGSRLARWPSGRAWRGRPGAWGQADPRQPVADRGLGPVGRALACPRLHVAAAPSVPASARHCEPRSAHAAERQGRGRIPQPDGKKPAAL